MHEPTRIGELVGGKYRITRLIAQGGMGVVYEAQHEIVRRRFAVKLLRPDYAHRREFLSRFQREAEAAGALENEHIASAVDFGIADDGSPFIVMEYLVGENLASLLEREGPLPVERAADLCIQACHGAEAAHAAGILHRDLKPKNLFVGRRDDGTDLLKILDFGIAKLAPLRYDHTTTDTGTIVGTPAYMSPEQARGERSLDPRSDVCALGTILFEMLSGQLPHPGDSPNAILHHLSTRPPISLAVAAPGLPGELVELVGKTLSPDVAVRPQSASALGQGLAPFARRQVWPDRSSEGLAGSGAATGDEPSAESILAPAVAPDRAPASGRRRVALGAAGLLIVGMGATAFLTLSHKTTPSSAGATPPIPKTEAPAPKPLPPPTAQAQDTASPAIAAPIPTEPESPRNTRVKLLPRKRTHIAGDATGAPNERPEGPSPSIPNRAPAPSAAPQATRKSMPRPSFDPANPYVSP